MENSVGFQRTYFLHAVSCLVSRVGHKWNDSGLKIVFMNLLN